MWKTWIPASVKAWYRASGFNVKHRSQFCNVYHCTIQKAASQWMRGLLSDERTHRYSGLDACLPENDAGPFPSHTIVSPLYMDFASFAKMAKAAPYRAFFVMRDPRDVLASWYFSLKLSHAPTPEIERIRSELLKLSEADGLLYALDFLHEYGLFATQRSWADAPNQDAEVALVRYEDLIGPQQATVIARLLAHCDIAMPAAVQAELLEAYSFEAVSGRPRGQEDPQAHYRKGVAGDWRNHFGARLEARFRAVAGDVLELWRYE